MEVHMMTAPPSGIFLCFWYFWFSVSLQNNKSLRITKYILKIYIYFLQFYNIPKLIGKKILLFTLNILYSMIGVKLCFGQS